jgi:hypothetical protein
MKIFILEPSFLNIANNIAERLSSINDDLTICTKYSSNTQYIDEPTRFTNYMNIDDINLSFKNNSLLYITYKENDISCITTDNYYNNNIIPIKYEEFINIISEYLVDSLIVIIDSKEKPTNKKTLKDAIHYFDYIEEIISNNKLKYLYFLDNDVDSISNIINSYVVSDESKRANIINEYS